jgi:hypothetical protein
MIGRRRNRRPIACSTPRQASGITPSDRRHAQRALDDGDFAVSDYFIDRIMQAPGLRLPRLGDRQSWPRHGLVLAPLDFELRAVDRGKLRTNQPNSI